MHLASSRVTKYKSVDDSTEFSIEPDITCLVGKNESGKSAILEALYRLKPLSMGLPDSFDGLRDYPRRTFAFDEDRVPDTQVISASFELTADETAAFESRFGVGALKSPHIEYSRDYNNKMYVAVDLDSAVLLAHVKRSTVLAGLDLSDVGNLAELRAAIDAVEDPSEQLAGLRTRLKISLEQQVRNWLTARLPKLLLFTQYNTMGGSVSIERLQTVSEDDLDAHERTALSLMRLARVDTEKFDETNYEARKARLEAAANALTDEVFEFWSQNEDLQVELDIDFVPKEAAPHEPEPFLKIRIRNNQHRVTLDFSERSVGFVWFFSFLAFFSEYRQSDSGLVLLLDEPGLNLHAAAQADLLRFIDERLATSHQVIYTSHSPFMIQPDHLERVRLIEDKKGEGTRVREDALGSQEETQFPIHAAIGIKAAQTLFIGQNTLILEGPADLMYFQALNERLGQLGMDTLSPDWILTPVGGLDKIPTFLALLSQQLNVAAVHDSNGKKVKRLANLVEKGIIDESRIVDVLDFAPSSPKAADLEDLFDPDWYLSLLHLSRVADLRTRTVRSKDPRVVVRVETTLGHGFSHYAPAAYLRRHPEHLEALDDDSLRRFESLFRRLNSLLE
jgi:predicted ATP-dependent endonuclease of OLD family